MFSNSRFKAHLKIGTSFVSIYFTRFYRNLIYTNVDISTRYYLIDIPVDNNKTLTNIIKAAREPILGAQN